MRLMFASATVARMDAGSEPTGTYSRRVAEVNIDLMSVTLSNIVEYITWVFTAATVVRKGH